MSEYRDPSDELLDEAVEQVREDDVDTATRRRSAARSWEKIGAELGVPAREVDGGCEQFREVLGLERAGALSEGRRLLLRDHLHACPSCRRAHELAPRAVAEAPAGSGGAKVVPLRRPAAAVPGRRFGAIQLAVAATLLLAVGSLSWLAVQRGAWRGVGDGGGGGDDIAAVELVRGELARVSGTRGATSLRSGADVRAGEEVRTAKGARAVIRLFDGSLVEMREGSAMTLARLPHETTIKLDRGSIIVEAAKQRDGVLRVATPEALVTVTGTIFSVSHGTTGGRVSVIEGEVRVAHHGAEQRVRPGQQVTTADRVARIPVAQDIAWSDKAEDYHELVARLTELAADLRDAVPAPGPRYQSELLPLLPSGTVAFASVPNYSETIGESYRFLRDRIAEDAMLRSYWQQVQGGELELEAFEQILTAIEGLGRSLGEEVGFAVVNALETAPERGLQPLVLARLTDEAAFQEALAAVLARVAASGARPELALTRITADTNMAALPAEPGRVYLWAGNGVLAAGLSAELASRVAQAAAHPEAASAAEERYRSALASAYGEGVSWIVGIDVAGGVDAALARSAGDAAQARLENVLRRAGLLDVDQVILRGRSDGDGEAQSEAVLSFTGERRGLPSWLGEPAPMGSLDLISADARTMIVVLTKQPAAMVEDLAGLVAAAHPDAATAAAGSWGDLQKPLQLLRGIAAELGGELAIAVDGPLLPLPAWKLVLEVTHPATIQSRIAAGVVQVNEALAAAGEKSEVTVSCAPDSEALEVCQLSWPAEHWEVSYAVVDGYLVVVPARALLDKMMRFRAVGHTMASSEAFASRLPRGAHTDFSAVAYERLRPDTPASVGVAYVESDRIVVSGETSAGGLADNLGLLFGVGDIMARHAEQMAEQ